MVVEEEGEEEEGEEGSGGGGGLGLVVLRLAKTELGSFSSSWGHTFSRRGRVGEVG